LSQLNEKDLDFLLGLVDQEIHRICNDPDVPRETPGPEFLNQLDHAWLRRFGACWELK
jgi:hypothetical protein